MTLYDRYLLSRFASVFAIAFVAAYGLFMVVDGFTNLDGFQKVTDDTGQGNFALVTMMAQHYFLRLFVMFNMLGPTLVIVSAMATLAMGLKFGEIHPLMAAGIRGHRVCLPLVIASLTVSGLLALNREFVLPRIAAQLQGKHGDVMKNELKAEPLYDPQGIFIAGDALMPSDRAIRGPRFRLPAPDLVSDYVVLEADTAEYLPETASEPGGWLLHGVSTPVDDLGLTQAGRQAVVAQKDPTLAFVITPVSFEELSDRSQSYLYMSTIDLVRRIRKTPVTDALSSTQVVFLHDRLTAPVLGIIGVMIAAPLVVRKERWSIVGNMAIATLVVGLVYGVSQACHTLGQSDLVPPDLAVWTPLILGGGLAMHLAPEMRS